MAAKPETRFIDKIRRHLRSEWGRSIHIVKHSNSFVRGIPDLEIILQIDTIVRPSILWLECKWVPSIKHQRTIKLQPLQAEELYRRGCLGVPSGVMIGSPYGVCFKPSIPKINPLVLREEFKSQFHIETVLNEFTRIYQKIYGDDARCL